MPKRLLDSEFHKAIVDNLADGVYYVDRERTITYWNRGAERISGYTAADVVGHPCFSNILAHVDAEGRSLCFDLCPLAATIGDGETREATIWLRHRDGFRRPVRVRTAPIHDADGDIVGGVEVFSDATAVLEAEEDARRARRDALTDELTGLPNRRHFEAALAGRLENLQRYGWQFGLLVADVDMFKRVNDDHGHAVGDAVLASVAQTLAGGVRGGDTVARWGGEEFAVLMEASDRRKLAELAERLRFLVGASEVRRQDVALTVQVSVGGALARVDDTAETLFERADAALLEAKRAGRNRVVLEPEREGQPQTQG